MRYFPILALTLVALATTGCDGTSFPDDSPIDGPQVIRTSPPVESLADQSLVVPPVVIPDDSPDEGSIDEGVPVLDAPEDEEII